MKLNPTISADDIRPGAVVTWHNLPGCVVVTAPDAAGYFLVDAPTFGRAEANVDNVRHISTRVAA